MGVLDFIKDMVQVSKTNFNESLEVIIKDEIPDNAALEVNRWYRISNVTAVYIDMNGSTTINVTEHPRTSAKIYEAFTKNIVKVFKAFGASYIDIQGDGAFGLFDGSDGVFRAFCAAVTFKSLSQELAKFIEEKTTHNVKISSSIGMETGKVLMKRIGVRGDNKEVWVGKPVNISSKLCSFAGENELILSDTVFGMLKDDHVRYCCPCSEKSLIWDEVDFNKYGMQKVYLLKSNGWCKTHGDEYCEAILNLG